MGNLDPKVTADQLKELFSQAGTVVSARVVAHQPGRSKGFGFVEMSTEQEAQEAIGQLHGQKGDYVKGLVVMEAKSKGTAAPVQAQPKAAVKKKKAPKVVPKVKSQPVFDSTAGAKPAVSPKAEPVVTEPAQPASAPASEPMPVGDQQAVEFSAEDLDEPTPEPEAQAESSPLEPAAENQGQGE